MSDPRNFFAAERTLLAWIRTGLTIIALGFVVARFGLFMRLFARSVAAEGVQPETSRLSGPLGVLLVGVGAFAVILAATQFRGYVRTLQPDGFPPNYRTSTAVILAYTIAAIGVVLGVYLAR